MTKRILVVEDDVMVRNTIVKMLIHENCEVLEANGFGEALQVLNSFDGVIDLLLIADYSPQTTTGRQTLKQLLESRSGLRSFHMGAPVQENPERQGSRTPEAATLQNALLSRNLANDIRRILDSGAP